MKRLLSVLCILLYSLGFVSCDGCRSTVEVTVVSAAQRVLYVDDQLVGKTPWKGVVARGMHRFRVVGECDAVAEEDRLLDQNLQLELSPPVPQAQVQINVRDPAGKALGNAKLSSELGEYPPNAPTSMPTCTMLLVASSPGMGALSLPVSLTENSSLALDVTLSPGGPMRRIPKGEVDTTNEVPRTSSTVECFDVDEGPVTMAAYKQCEKAGLCPLRSDGCGGRSDQEAAPECIDYYAASTFCRTRGLRLPTRHELMRAEQELADSPPLYERTSHTFSTGWLIDGYEEPGAPGNDYRTKKGERESTLAFRCVEHAPRPQARTNDVPCFASCDGSIGDLDDIVDERWVFDVDTKGRWVRTTVLAAIAAQGADRNKGTLSAVQYLEASLLRGEESQEEVAKELKVLSRDPMGLPLAVSRDDWPPVYLGYDAYGRVTWLWKPHSEGGVRCSVSYECRANNKSQRECPRLDGVPSISIETGFGNCQGDRHERWYPAFSNWEVSKNGELVFVSADLAFRYVSGSNDATSEKVTIALLAPDEESSAKLLALYDFDGDGHKELVVQHNSYAGESNHDEGYVLSYREGKVVPYPPSVEFAAAIEAVEDVNHDGRPDLVVSDHFVAADDGHDLRCHAGFPSIVHSLPDGTFSRTDEVVRKYLKRSCPRHPGARLFGTKGDVEEAYKRMNCMWLWGDSEVQLRERIANEWPIHGCSSDDPGAGDCACFREEFETQVNRLVESVPHLLKP